MKETRFPDNASLPLLQKYVKEKCIERGFDRASDLEICLLFTEEIGEMAKAIRKQRSLFEEEAKAPTADENEEARKQRIKANLGEEMADVLSYLLDLANRFDVDLASAFRTKEAENDKRSWK